ncbi:hypothetical protein NUITMVRE18_02010 [Enterococcus faecium]|uniref:hypothetical protein n=1 Tax=Enterococcus faecium TaxID=1352 RepID=UPI000DFD39B4|nr:hypothetical protein EB09_02538 [Enterococcus faecium]GMR83371.1 hypothetical protein NUITMVRE14_02010 [Enterococcus faecium]GMR89160.1 hypothetical protein NUITMVRE16_02490 [Enterococcus faecium]GMR91930.1 hypothetical protein NUITMVRE17_02010 [Enterococcus faecium]GMR94746.1 hypothetical protein NUITMVRE18_02010 [Enterococcus faecium]
MDVTASSLIGHKGVKEDELVLLVLIRIKKSAPLSLTTRGTLKNKVINKLYLTTF